MKSLLLIFLLLATEPVLAIEGKLVRINTRPGVSVSFYYMKHDGAEATLALLPGGGGDIAVKDGIPTSSNFLVRSRELFASHNFNVAILDRPSDRADLDFSSRVSREHMEDIHHVVAFLREDSPVPVWLVGTSRGTISAAAAAISFGNAQLGGIVLTSSVTSFKITGAVPTQKLGAIRLPVLVVHHERDECKTCDPSEVSIILRNLKNAPVKRKVIITGGGNPVGDPCESMHWHGFIGKEIEVTDIISDWIKHPSP